jgi:hypothetical protein
VSVVKVRLPFLVFATASAAFAGCLGADENESGDDTPAVTVPLYAQIFPQAGWASAWDDPRTFFTSPNDSPSKAEVDVRINPTDPNNVVVASKDLDLAASDCVWAVAQVTTDGGATWTTVYVGGDQANRDPLFASFDCITDPMFTFDDEGTLYYALQAYGTEVPVEGAPEDVGGQVPLSDVGSTFILGRSRDGGLTWDHFAVQHGGDGLTVFHDYPRIIVSPVTGAIHTIWNGFNSMYGQATVSVQPWISSSRDGGETVDPPRTIVSPDSTNIQFFSGFDATESGTIFVTINKGEDSDSGAETNVWIYRSDDDAETFVEVGNAFSFKPTPRQLPEQYNAFRTPSFVEMAIDRSGGPFHDRIHLFWPDYGAGDSDIMTSHSDDGGQTWSEPLNVAADATNDQLFMRPKVGPDGVVQVLFASRAWDPANKLLDMVHGWSEDGGATWNNTRLTSSPFDGDLGIHQNGFPFIGDYNGLDVVGDHVWMAWGDTRTGRAEIAAAHVVKTPPSGT